MAEPRVRSVSGVAGTNIGVEPSDAASGDTLYAIVNSTASGVSGPTGWTGPIDDTSWVAGTRFMSRWYRTRPSTPLSVGELTWGAAAARVFIVCLTGDVDPATLFDAAGSAVGAPASGTSPGAPSVTPVPPYAKLICGVLDDSGAATITTPAGMPQEYNNTANGCAIASLDLGPNSGGSATGTKTFTLSGADNYITWSVAIRSEAAPAPWARERRTGFLRAASLVRAGGQVWGTRFDRESWQWQRTLVEHSPWNVITIKRGPTVTDWAPTLQPLPGRGAAISAAHRPALSFVQQVVVAVEDITMDKWWRQPAESPPPRTYRPHLMRVSQWEQPTEPPAPTIWRAIIPVFLPRPRPSPPTGYVDPAFPVLASETITIDKWLGSRPDRLSGRQRPVVQPQAPILRELVTLDMWWAEGVDYVRARPRMVGTGIFAINLNPPAEVITVDKWWRQSPERPAARRRATDVGMAALQLYPEIVTMDKWWAQARERINPRPRPLNAGGPAFQLSQDQQAINPAILGWFRQASEPRRFRPIQVRLGYTVLWHSGFLIPNAVAIPPLARLPGGIVRVLGRVPGAVTGASGQAKAHGGAVVSRGRAPGSVTAPRGRVPGGRAKPGGATPAAGHTYDQHNYDEGQYGD